MPITQGSAGISELSESAQAPAAAWLVSRCGTAEKQRHEDRRRGGATIARAEQSDLNRSWSYPIWGALFAVAGEHLSAVERADDGWSGVTARPFPH